MGKSRLYGENTRPYMATLLSLVAVAVIYLFGQLNLQILAMISDAIYQAVYIALIVSAITLNNKYGWSFREKIPRIWLLASFSIFSAYIADSTWDIYYYVLRVPLPYPSAADIFYLLSLILGVQALTCYIIVFRYSLSWKALLLSGVAILASGILITQFMIYPILLQPLGDAEKLLGITYIAIDFTIFSLSIVGLAIFFSGKIGRAWFFLALSMFLIMVGEFLFLYLLSVGEIAEASIDDLPAVSGLILLVLAFNLYRRQA